MVLAASGLAILIFGVVQKKDSSTLCTMLVLAAFAVAAMLVVHTPPNFAYSGLFVTDAFATYAKLLILGGGALTAVLALDFNERTGIGRFEFPVLMLFSTVGMMVMASAASLMTLYMGLELQSLAIYVLCAFARDDVRSSEAGLKYFVLSALASGLLLYGISLTYGFSGTMDFGRLAQAITDPAGVSTGLVVGIAFVVAGLAFKLSAVPFHMWTPDVYEGAPTPVTAFMSTAPKVAPFVVLLRVMIGPFGHVAVQWQPIIYVVSIGSMVLGSCRCHWADQHQTPDGIFQHRPYGLRADWAGRRHAGWRTRRADLSAHLRGTMSAGAFACIIAMRRGRQAGGTHFRPWRAGQAPIWALASLLAIFMFSMAGIPPFGGFFGKLYVFLAAVKCRHVGFLAILGVLTSVIGCFYYLRIVKVMFFDPAEPAFDRQGRRACPSSPSPAGAFTVLFHVRDSPPFTSAAAASSARSCLAKIMPGGPGGTASSPPAFTDTPWSVVTVEETPSTQDLAIAAAQTADAPNRTAYHRRPPDRTAAGREGPGLDERPAGNLNFSALLRPGRAPSQLRARWALMAALAVHEAVAAKFLPSICAAPAEMAQ